MERTYKVGTRTSTLALKQVEEVLGKIHPSIKAAIVDIESFGDKDKTTPISEIEGSDFFTREIDEALLNGDIDFAVHSAKDLPDTIPHGLCVAAITESIDPYDVLVSKDGLKLRDLPFGAKIGTSSLRRKNQLKKFRKDFQIVDIRGNIEDRLRLLDASDPRSIDAIVIAAAGLLRLGLEHRITQKIPFSILKPHPLQGRLAIVTRAEDADLIKVLSKLDSRKAVLT